MFVLGCPGGLQTGAREPTQTAPTYSHQEHLGIRGVGKSALVYAKVATTRCVPHQPAGPGPTCTWGPLALYLEPQGTWLSPLQASEQAVPSTRDAAAESEAPIIQGSPQ